MIFDSTDDILFSTGPGVFGNSQVLSDENFWDVLSAGLWESTCYFVQTLGSLRALLQMEPLWPVSVYNEAGEHTFRA